MTPVKSPKSAMGKNRSISMLATKKGELVRSSTKMAITSVSNQRPVLVRKPKLHNEIKERSRCSGTSGGVSDSRGLVKEFI